jgi:N-methylhydantoinase B/oxoprolinase/acetone carboxylase alpha subunit
MARAAKTPAPAVDPIKAEVVARFLLGTAEEMGATLQRTAFSPNIKERADCSTAVFDRQGQVVALAQRVPIHLGSMVGAVEYNLTRSTTMASARDTNPIDPVTRRRPNPAV